MKNCRLCNSPLGSPHPQTTLLGASRWAYLVLHGCPYGPKVTKMMTQAWTKGPGDLQRSPEKVNFSTNLCQLENR